MLHSLIHTWFHWVQDWGYWGVIVLMAMESSIFPVPSEVVIPPAAFLAADENKLNLYGVILAGILGSWIGSAVTYAISRWVAVPVIVKWGKYFFISEDKLDRAERLMARYEAGGIFFARLLPVVRHLISIPAGIVRMPFGKFSLMTILGSGVWCSILAWYGKGVAERNPKLMNNPEELIHAVKQELPWLVVAVIVVCALYFVMLKLTEPRRRAAKGETEGKAE